MVCLQHNQHALYEQSQKKSYSCCSQCNSILIDIVIMQFVLFFVKYGTCAKNTLMYNVGRRTDMCTRNGASASFFFLFFYFFFFLTFYSKSPSIKLQGIRGHRSVCIISFKKEISKLFICVLCETLYNFNAVENSNVYKQDNLY